MGRANDVMFVHRSFGKPGFGEIAPGIYDSNLRKYEYKRNRKGLWEFVVTLVVTGPIADVPPPPEQKEKGDARSTKGK